VLVDIQHETFIFVLHYIYTGKVPKPKDNDLTVLEELFDASDRFWLPHLKGVCEEMLECVLDLDNFVFILTLADHHMSAQLKNVCFFFIEKHSALITSPKGREYLAELPKGLIQEFNTWLGLTASQRKKYYLPVPK
jgi:hypothetical protein